MHTPGPEHAITGICRTLVQTLLLAAMVAGAPNVGTAEAALTRVTCRLRVHIALSRPLDGTPTRGQFSSTRPGTADCAGWLDGALTDGTGWIEVNGTYRTRERNLFGNPLGAFDTCALGQRRMSLLAATPILCLTFPRARSIRQPATLRLQPIARALIATGSGRAGTPSALGPGSGQAAFGPDREAPRVITAGHSSD